ncbi:5-deoxy-glucuronate isomerase [Mahella sp.]|uniref:5-deoxy-glucuronate isomerase n=1 Tax=Mahella sp. TaxID=2798721 RepID=UPI0025C5181F|nr:5-deoxy-glucuronate isomerase [Mahella sp.]MBZ4666222.1 5-deoxyglucuronate isomerase [Mahella sp.]
MLIRRDKPFDYSYNSIVHEDQTGMDFGILKLKKDQEFAEASAKERAILLIQGDVVFEWENKKAIAHRKSFLDQNPWCLHVPSGTAINIKCISGEAELSVSQTDNSVAFDAHLYSDEECQSEQRGKGTMNEMATRIVRTIFDYSNAPYSNLVLGEVINYPGKWSSYPPHHHPQPEIYFYKFSPENGFGFCNLGENVLKVKNNDTVEILNDASHPQVSAPGYAMYYIWVIRHLEGNPYITPTFEPEHLWVMRQDAVIWPTE